MSNSLAQNTSTLESGGYVS